VDPNTHLLAQFLPRKRFTGVFLPDDPDVRAQERDDLQQLGFRFVWDDARDVPHCGKLHVPLGQRLKRSSLFGALLAGVYVKPAHQNVAHRRCLFQHGDMACMQNVKGRRGKT